MSRQNGEVGTAVQIAYVVVGVLLILALGAIALLLHAALQNLDADPISTTPMDELVRYAVAGFAAIVAIGVAIAAFIGLQAARS